MDELRRQRMAERDGGSAGGKGGANGGADEQGAMVLSGRDARSVSAATWTGRTHLARPDASVRQTPSEAPWVRLAEKELARLERAGRSGGSRSRSALGAGARGGRRAKELREEGKADEADAVLQGLRICTGETRRRKRFWRLADQTGGQKALTQGRAGVQPPLALVLVLLIKVAFSDSQLSFDSTPRMAVLGRPVLWAGAGVRGGSGLRTTGASSVGGSVVATGPAMSNRNGLAVITWPTLPCRSVASTRT